MSVKKNKLPFFFFFVSFLFSLVWFNRGVLNGEDNHEIKSLAQKKYIERSSFKQELSYIANRYSANLKVVSCSWINKIENGFKPLLKKMCNLKTKKNFDEAYELTQNLKEKLLNSTIFEMGLYDIIVPQQNLLEYQNDFRKKLLNLFGEYERPFIIKGFAFGDCMLKRDYNYALDYLKGANSLYGKALVVQALKDCFFIHHRDNPDWSKIKISNFNINQHKFYLRKRLENTLGRKLKKEEALFITMEKTREKLVILDEMSQIAYLQKDYPKVVRLCEEYLKAFPSSEDFYFLNQKAIVSVRRAKALLRVGDLEGASGVLRELPSLQTHMIKLKETYYPDVSLASLLWKKGESQVVLDYLKELKEKRLISVDTFTYLKKGLESQEKFNLELALYKIRYKGKEETEYYKAELEQIKDLAE